MKALMITIVFILFIGCTTHTHWTEEQRKEFAEKCLKIDTTNHLNFSLTGFRYDEIKNITVRQIHKGKIVDSFCVHPDENSFDSLRTQYSASINKHLYIRDSFEFTVQGYKPFILSNMKMIMWPQFLMSSENYGCVMGDYKINGIRFEDDANPDFIKNGFKFSWEK